MWGLRRLQWNKYCIWEVLCGQKWRICTIKIVPVHEGVWCDLSGGQISAKRLKFRLYVYRWFVLETNFNDDNRVIFSKLAWDFFSHPLLCVFCISKMWIYRLVTVGMLVIFLCWHNHVWKPSYRTLLSQSVSWMSQVTMDMLLITNSSNILLSVWQQAVVMLLSLYLVSPVSVLMDKCLIDLFISISLIFKVQGYMGIYEWQIYAATV